MKPICKFLLDPRDEPQTLIIPKKIYWPYKASKVLRVVKNFFREYA